MKDVNVSDDECIYLAVRLVVPLGEGSSAFTLRLNRYSTRTGVGNDKKCIPHNAAKKINYLT